MNKSSASKPDTFFSDVNFTSIVDNIRNIYVSDGSMSILMDYERVLDEADLYAFKNWINGELVIGPETGRYNTTCTFMWPHKLMPDPKGALRLTNIGCKVVFGKGKIKIPVKVESPDDFLSGGKYPKLSEKKVWYVRITIPLELMDDIKEGSIDMAGTTIDLSEIEEAYDDDLDAVAVGEETAPVDGGEDMGGDFGGADDMGMGM